MQSIAQQFKGRTVGVVLTGMGVDGTEGAGAIRDMGGYVVAQDEASSVIYGMPRSIVENDLAHQVVPLRKVAETITELVEQLPDR